MKKICKESHCPAKFYKISPDPIETEVLEDEWCNFKFEVLPNWRHDDDNWQTIS